MVKGGSELTHLTQLLIFDYRIMVSMINERSAKHPATLAISNTILLYYLIKVKPRLDVKVERLGDGISSRSKKQTNRQT